MALKSGGVKTKTIYYGVQFSAFFFSKVRKYKIKYRTKICDFTVPGGMWMCVGHPSPQNFLSNVTFLLHQAGGVNKSVMEQQTDK